MATVNVSKELHRWLCKYSVMRHQTLRTTIDDACRSLGWGSREIACKFVPDNARQVDYSQIMDIIGGGKT